MMGNPLAMPNKPLFRPCDAATFYDPAGIVVDKKGNVIISDSSNNRIRQLCPNGTVTTLAGGEAGCKDGNARVAMFRNQGGLALHPNGSIIIADSGNHRIRRLSPDGEVTTVAGGERGYLDGPGANLTACTQQNRRV